MGKGAVESVAWESVDVAPGRYPVNRNLNSVTPAFGLYAAHCKGLRLRDVQNIPAIGDECHGIALDQVEDFLGEGLQMGEASPEVVHRPPA